MAIKACCTDAKNLDVTMDPERPALTIKVCRVCHARHFTLKAETGRFVATGKPLGK